MKKLMYILLVLTAFSCSKETKIPKGIYPKETMVMVLKDLYMYQAQIENLKIKDVDSVKMIFKSYEDTVFARYNVDDTTYMESYKFYVNNPELLTDIFQAMTDSLSLQKRLLEEERKP